MKIDELRKERGELLDDNDELLAKGDEATEDDMNTIDKNLEAIASIDKNIERLEAQAKASGKKFAAPVSFETQETNKDEKTLVENYKIVRHISNLKKLDGAEAEMQKEGEKEADLQGKQTYGNIQIPSRYFAFGEKRDLTIATEGADVEFDQNGGVIPILRANPIMSQLGAQTISGLVGDLRFPRHNAAASMAWEGETDAGAETTPTFDQVLLQPKRLGGYTEISGKFMRQAEFSAEAWVRQELSTALTLALDSASISGATGGDNPVGVLNISGIGSVALGTNGAVPTWASVVNLKREVNKDNALMGNLSYLGNPDVSAKLETTLRASSTDSRFIKDIDGGLAGYNYADSTQVPSDLTKGTGTALSALIFGNFSDAIFGQWGVIDLLVDPYTVATSGLVRIVINGYFDFDVRHPESFAAIQDMVTT